MVMKERHEMNVYNPAMVVSYLGKYLQIDNNNYRLKDARESDFSEIF